mmetsp:Transcript_1312/g.3766  ORF Transcript_1312/g.3766 Transcript_1312/m.3766 type:complete len:216 (-) Transcript_1312:364-1011(-)
MEGGQEQVEGEFGGVVDGGFVVVVDDDEDGVGEEGFELEKSAELVEGFVAAVVEEDVETRRQRGQEVEGVALQDVDGVGAAGLATFEVGHGELAVRLEGPVVDAEDVGVVAVGRRAQRRAAVDPDFQVDRRSRRPVRDDGVEELSRRRRHEAFHRVRERRQRELPTQRRALRVRQRLLDVAHEWVVRVDDCRRRPRRPRPVGGERHRVAAQHSDS